MNSRSPKKPQRSCLNSFFLPEQLEFPFRDDVAPEESGQGYALRMAAENHLNGLPQLKAWLGKSRFVSLDAADAQQLHKWFGASKTRLEHALGWISTGNGATRYTYAGHVLGRSYFFNRSYPRVCFLCLEAEGHCRSSWDFALTVACAKHRVLLADTCGVCTRSITWNRPSPRTCSCHLNLQLHANPPAAAALEVQFSSWLEGFIAGHRRRPHEAHKQPLDITDAPEDATALMRLVWPLSLTGGMQVIFALATAAGYDDSTRSMERRARTPLRKAQQFLASANDIAQKIGHADEILLRVQRPSVVIQLLADYIAENAPPADRHLARSILCTALRQKQKTRWSSVNPQLSQLMLF